VLEFADLVIQDEGESLTRSRALTIFPGMAFMAGLLGGMLGVGGGMIINPLLTELGMHPQVKHIFKMLYCLPLVPSQPRMYSSTQMSLC
jgi:tetrahydromethanopterin S-methyltransferase subunit D